MSQQNLKAFSIYQKIHFIGIGGIGISALARLLKQKGHIVSGSDREESNNTNLLISEGIDVKFGHSRELLPEDTSLVIYTRAISDNNPELLAAREKGITTISYPEAIGKLTNDFKTICICGTHGKTTTTAMLGKICLDAGTDPTVIVGSIVSDFNNKNELVGKSNLLILEACEYKESFLNYKPYIVVLNNIEPEHLDYFKTEENYIEAFRKFINKIPKDGILIANGDDKNIQKLLNEKEYNFQIITFGHNEDNEFLLNYKTISTPQRGDYDLDLNLPGEHNYMNATAAFVTALSQNISPEQIVNGLNHFTGAARRFEIKGKIGNTTIVDDYAHAPTEIQATLNAAKEKFGQDSKILCVFQPHQYSRTYLFLEEFGKSFKKANKVLIPNIYRSRDTEEDVSKVNVDMLVQKINSVTPGIAQNTHNFETTLTEISNIFSEYDAIITIGAGNITELSNQIISSL